MSLETMSAGIQEKKSPSPEQLEILANVFGRKRLRMMREMGIADESDSRHVEQLKNEVIIRFEPENVSPGLIVQKFVLLKNNEGYIFGTIPESEAREHLDIAKIISQEKGLKEGEYENDGGGFLNYDVKENAIRFDTMAKSQKMGPIKISWEELLQIVRGSAGSDYKIELDEY